MAILEPLSEPGEAENCPKRGDSDGSLRPSSRLDHLQYVTRSWDSRHGQGKGLGVRFELSFVSVLLSLGDHIVVNFAVFPVCYAEKTEPQTMSSLPHQLLNSALALT